LNGMTHLPGDLLFDRHNVFAGLIRNRLIARLIRRNGCRGSEVINLRTWLNRAAAVDASLASRFIGARYNRASLRPERTLPRFLKGS
jgi:hypothetical protein